MKETIVIQSEADLCLKNNQLVITYPSSGQQFIRPIEDIRVLMIDHHSAHLTVPILNTLSENNVAVIFCNEKHFPVSMLMDLEFNNIQTKYYRFQLDASKPLKKHIWKRVYSRTRWNST